MNHDTLGKVGIDVGHIAISSTDDDRMDRAAQRLSPARVDYTPRP
jgi:hypothetical protein